MLASLLVNISTHALTEGDVSRKYFCNRSPRISTHALTEGDHWFDAAKAAHGISTHALTEGDNISFMTFSCECYFNSRPHGGRHGFIVPLANFFHFNSRPHGGRQRTRADDNTGGVFQLTPSRRATSLYFWIASSSGLFQLTPSRRATGTSRN